MYREILVKEQNVAQALKYIETEVEQSPERNYILDFIKNSQRGIIRGYNVE